MSTFSTVYTGPGTSTLGVTNGLAHWTAGTNAARTGIARYTTAPTLSDYQLVGKTLASGPAYGWSTLTSAANTLCARMNSTNDSYVYAKFTTNGFLQYFAELGYVLSGTKTVWVSPAVVPTNANMWLKAGTPGGLRQYQILSGTIPVISYTESGTSSALGSSNRFYGFGGDVIAGLSSPMLPGDVAGVSVADNMPPNTVGSYFRAYRLSTTTINVTSGYNVLPANFFDTIDRETADFNWVASTNTLTVSIEGTYMVNIGFDVASIPNNGKLSPSIAQNGLLKRQVNGGFADTSFANSPANVGGCALIYCRPGDTLQPGTWAAGSYTGCITGDGFGAGSYFEAALVNKSLL